MYYMRGCLTVLGLTKKGVMHICKYSSIVLKLHEFIYLPGISSLSSLWHCISMLNGFSLSIKLTVWLETKTSLVANN